MPIVINSKLREGTKERSFILNGIEYDSSIVESICCVLKSVKKIIVDMSCVNPTHAKFLLLSENYKISVWTQF